MNFNIKICNISSTITVSEDNILYFEAETERTLAYEDVIGLEKTGDAYRLHYIQNHPKPDYKLTKEYIEFTTEDTVFTQLNNAITCNIQKVIGRPKKLVVFVNPIAGRHNGKQTCDDTVVPLLTSAGIQTDVVVSQKAEYGKEFAETYDFKSVDGLVIMGGDGTISEVMNVLMRKTQQEADLDINDQNTTAKTIELPIAVIPTGSANGVAFFAYGCKDVLIATLHIIKGRRNTFNTVACFNRNRLVGYGFICFGYGFYSDLMNNVDNNFRWLRTLRYLFVPLWHALFRPIREIDVELTYEYLDGSEPDDITDEERKNRRAIRHKRITNILGAGGDLALEENPAVKTPPRYDQLVVLDYVSCNRYTFLRHMFDLGKLTKTKLDRVKHFVSYNRLSGFGLRVVENSNPVENLLFNIDGETHKLTSPEFNVKLFPRSYTVFTSYTGTPRWS